MDIVKLIIVIFLVGISVVSATKKGMHRKRTSNLRPPIIPAKKFTDEVLVSESLSEAQPALHNEQTDENNTEPYIQNEEAIQSENDDIEQWRQAIINAEILKTKF